MEIIIKLIKGLFFTEDEEANKTAIGKLKNGILWMILGAALLMGVLCYIADDEETEDDEVEMVEQETED